MVIPAANLLEAIYDAKKMRPFFGIITPTVDHQINELGPHFHRGQVWAKWRVVMPHDTMDNFCITKGTKKNCSIQMENSLCLVWHDVSSQPRKSSEFPSWESHSKTLTMFFVCCFFAHKCSLLTRGWESFSDKGPDFYHQRIFLIVSKVSDDSKRPATNFFSQK